MPQRMDDPPSRTHRELQAATDSFDHRIAVVIARISADVSIVAKRQHRRRRRCLAGQLRAERLLFIALPNSSA